MTKRKVTWNNSRIEGESRVQDLCRELSDAGLFHYIRGTAEKYLQAAALPEIDRSVMAAIQEVRRPGDMEVGPIGQGTVSALLRLGHWLDALVLILDEEAVDVTPDIVALAVYSEIHAIVREGFVNQAIANDVPPTITGYVAFFVEMFGAESMAYENVLIQAMGDQGLIMDEDYVQIHAKLLDDVRRLRARQLREEIDSTRS